MSVSSMKDIDPRIAARRSEVAEAKVRRGLLRFLWIAFLLALIATVAWLVRSPFLSVDEIVILGAERADVGRALTEAGVVEGVPLALVDIDAATELLDADPWIAEVTVVRDWPRRVVVTLRERHGTAWVETTEGWYLTAPDGVALEAGTPPESSPLVLLPGVDPDEMSSNDRLLGALEFLDNLRPDLTSGAVVGAVGAEMVAEVADLNVRLGLPDDMAAKARALAAVVDSVPPPGSVVTLIAPSRPAVLTQGE